MALLGALSLSGMLIKNAIVLIEEINLLLASGKAPWDAVVDASVSRVRSVSMAALTTVFGLIPLLFDVFFGAMAVTIIVGLLFATILTLIVVPVPTKLVVSCPAGAPSPRLPLNDRSSRDCLPQIEHARARTLTCNSTFSNAND